MHRAPTSPDLARPAEVAPARGATARALAIAVALLWLAAGGAAAQPNRPLTGQLLIASEEMPDPRFQRTVIYMVQHDATGAQGFVLNRPLRDIPLAALLEQMGLPAEGARGQVRLHAGGPVEALGVFALHTAEWSTPGTRQVPGGLSVTGQAEILRAIAEARGPRRVTFLLGYAGWAPGQLEAELRAGHWLKAAADEALVFDQDHETKWERARARQKIDL